MNAFELSDRLVTDIARAQPALATSHGIDSYDDRWGDLSPEGHAEVEAILRDYQERFEALPGTGDPWSDHPVAVARAYLETRLDFYVEQEHLRDLNSVASPVQTFRRVFDIMDTDSENGWVAIASRLEGLPAAIEDYVNTLEKGRQEGVTAARRQVLAAREEANVNAGPESFLLNLPGALDEAGMSNGIAPRVHSSIPAAQAAFGRLADYLHETYLPSAPDADAVGRDRYEKSAYRFCGTHLDLSETYEWGWEQVHGLRQKASDVAREIDSRVSLAEVMELLKTDPARAASSPAEFVEIMQKRQDQALEDLSGTHFDIPDAIRQVTVSIAPKGGSLGAYYSPPTEDFARPGSIWYSVGDQRIFPLYDEVSTAYHEGFPGHHLQVGYIMALGDRLSRLSRTFAWWSGSGEGWALYAEWLMGELGYFEEPDYTLGMLLNHLFRACRVVIDIGSHVGFSIPEHSPVRPGEPWSFDAAVELLEEVAFIQAANARSEVTRYLGWPGQAIAYEVGEQAILELRDAKRRRDADKFSLKDFHTQVLSAGSVGLDLLRAFVLSED
ncbi:MAG: DUF885 domain-containing protein [Acidimicrobiia bacterium]